MAADQLIHADRPVQCCSCSTPSGRPLRPGGREGLRSRSRSGLQLKATQLMEGRSFPSSCSTAGEKRTTSRPQPALVASQQPAQMSLGRCMGRSGKEPGLPWHGGLKAASGRCTLAASRPAPQCPCFPASTRHPFNTRLIFAANLEREIELDIDI